MLTNAPSALALDALRKAFHRAGLADVQFDARSFVVRGTAGATLQRCRQSVSGQIFTVPQGLIVQVESLPKSKLTWGNGRIEIQDALGKLESILRQMPGATTAPPLPADLAAAQRPLGAPIPSPHSSRATPYQPNPQINSSGRGDASILPSELRGFNLGAFFLSQFWGFSHRSVGWSALSLIFSGSERLILISLLAALYLGFYGNEIAWKKRRWDSIEHFQQVQKIWLHWGIAIWFGVLFVAIVYGLFSA